LGWALPLWSAELDPASDDFIDNFRGADIVLLGEVHDNALHHAVQARVVAGLEPSAVVFEMVEPGQARAITPDIRQDALKLETTLSWDARGWPDFAMYFPIFAAAKDAGFFGGALPRDEVRKAVSDGAAPVFGGAAPLFGLDRPLDEAQQSDREALQLAAHCDALPEDILPGMVEAQRLRDAALARAVVNAMQQDEEGPVVVIAGNGHVREDWGIPQALRIYLEATGTPATIVTLGQYELAAPEAPKVTHWVVTDAAEREEPCAAFR
jgi:uncharacterized iron-regulated protein